MTVQVSCSAVFRAHLTLQSPLEAERRSLTLTARLSLAWLLDNQRRKRAWQPLHLASLLSKPIMSCVRQWPPTLQKGEAACSLVSAFPLYAGFDLRFSTTLIVKNVQFN